VSVVKVNEVIELTVNVVVEKVLDVFVDAVTLVSVVEVADTVVTVCVVAVEDVVLSSPPMQAQQALRAVMPPQANESATTSPSAMPLLAHHPNVAYESQVWSSLLLSCHISPSFVFRSTQSRAEIGFWTGHVIARPGQHTPSVSQ
jgi:hypothetical protein